MYASLGQLVRGWSRILYDALGRSPWRLAGQGRSTPWSSASRGTSPWSPRLVMLATGPAGPFPLWLLGLSVVHHVLSYAVLRRLYLLSVPATRTSAWFPLANLVMDWVLLRSIKMCLTGRGDLARDRLRPGAPPRPTPDGRPEVACADARPASTRGVPSTLVTPTRIRTTRWPPRRSTP